MALTGSQKAYKFALSNVARSGATRSGYVSGFIFINIGGVEQRTNIGLDSLSITEGLDEVPNTCRFRVYDSVPAVGQTIVITLGSANGRRLFGGHILTVEELIGGKPSQVRADVSCVDFTWMLGFQKVTKRYTGWPVYVLVQDLIYTYASANGFTAINVPQTLPGIDEITFTNEDLPEALTRLARRIGAYWYVDYYKDVHFFFEDPGQAPTPLTPTHPTLQLAEFDLQRDRTQTLTRVYVEGRGTTLLSPVAIGDTRVPLDAVDMFTAAADVFLKASFQGSDGGAQHLTFTGVVPGGAGAIVGPGIGPSAPVTLTAQAGAGVESGAHSYAVTFTTASGESLPSPTASVTTGAVANPAAAPGPITQTPTGRNGSFIAIGHSITFVYTYGTGTASTSAPQTLPSAVSTPIVTVSNLDPLNAAQSAPISVAVPYAPDPRVTYIFVWARDPATTGGTFVSYGNVIPNNPAGGTYYLGGAGSNIFPANPVAPTSNTTSSNQINVTAIPVGAASVTQRKLYRTAAGAAQLKLLTTLPNNTATTYLDTLADASLGANVPVTDTSGLTQPAGSVFPGAPTLPVAGTSAFQAAGGWAIIGNGEQVIRYTGLTAGSLTGIPATGTGAITAAVNYNSTITAAPMLTGIPASGARSIERALTAGDELYLVVQVDDPARQAQLAASVGGDGIREEWVQDRRLSITEARARGQATLQVRTLDQVTIGYRCRDTLTAAGKTVTATFPAPLNISGTFKIQTVTIDNFRHVPTQPPTYHVQASSSRFSFEDWLRNLRTEH